MRAEIFPATIIASFVLSMMFLAGVARASNGDDPRLDAAASYVAGKPVAVWCETSEADWIHKGDSLGQDFSNIRGYSFPLDPNTSTIYVSPLVCNTLRALLGRGPQAVGAYWGSLAIHTLVHESTHLRTGSTDEHFVDCTALTQDASIATKFFGWPTTDTSYKTVLVRNAKRQIIGTKQVLVKTPSALMSAFKLFDQIWHSVAPPSYSGACP